MSRRRGDTRQRIQQVALELFAERGYDKTSLREIADRLGITRPALYYHFSTKQDILAGVIDDLAGTLDELIDWAADQPATGQAREHTLRRVAELIGDRWRPLIGFARVNQHAMKDLPTADTLQQRMLRLVSLFVDPADPPARRFEARLAMVAVLLGHLPDMEILDDPDVTAAQRSAISLDVALALLHHD